MTPAWIVRDKPMTSLAFLFPFLFFAAWPSRMWNFDGVACAAALELGKSIYFFHSNHLLYGFLGYVFWKPLPYSLLPRALPALQLFTSLLSAGAMVGVYQLLKRILDERRLALALTVGLSLTAVVWVWSIEAQVYALGFLALAWATAELFKPESSAKWRRIGWLHAGAILGHIVHVLWIIPAIYWLTRENTVEQRRKIRDYGLRLALGVGIPYLLVVFYMLGIKVNLHWFAKWLLGSASLNPNSLFAWHFAGVGAPLEWLWVTPRIFWGSFWPYHVVPTGLVWITTGFSIATLVMLLGFSWKHHRAKPWVFSVLWLAVYGVFFWTWEPRTECYRLTDVIPYGILLALGLKSLRRPALQWGCVAVLAATFAVINIQTRVIPMHQASNNALYQEILTLEAATPTNSLYLTAGGPRWIYLLYFTGRSAWNVQTFSRNPEFLRREISRHKTGIPVYINAEALPLGSAPQWLPPGNLKQVGSIPWMQLQ